MKIMTNEFGEWEGNKVFAHTMENNNGMSVTCIDYGCVITDIVTPDARGQIESVVLGFDEMDSYIQHSPYFGAFVGRTAGRIKQGHFELGGQTYQLSTNNGNNHIHGGPRGFSRLVWEAQPFKKEHEVGVVFFYTSPDGEEQYPGTLEMIVTYTLNDNNELKIGYDAISDKDTLLNVTNHSYFNLSGNLKRDILDHQLTIKSDQFAEIGDESLPTGTFIDVANTPFDMRQGRKIRSGVEQPHAQNTLVGGGYDHPFLLNTNHNKEIVLIDAQSGRMLTIETDEPNVVLYTSNKIQSHAYTIRGVPSRSYLGLCLETQKLPDAVHHDHFPSIILEKDTPFHSVTTYSFGLVSSS